MSRNAVNSAELALAAARTRELSEGMGDVARDALMAEWRDLIDEIENPRASSELALADYRAGIERRLATRLLHAPLHRERR